MGREIKRVALNFDWPLSERWEGFVNPHYVACPDCKGGQTTSGWALQRLAHLIHVVGQDSLERPKGFEPTPGQYRVIGRRNYPHPWSVEAGIDDPGEEFHELVLGLTGLPAEEAFSIGGSGQWEIMRKILTAAGLPEDWCTCKRCGGEGIHPDHQEVYEAWAPTQPPAGEGWQLWETVSEGSPITPVFTTAEELIDYMAKPPVGAGRVGWAQGYSRKVAEAFVKGPGWAPSGVAVGGVVMSGVEWVAKTESEPGR